MQSMQNTESSMVLFSAAASTQYNTKTMADSSEMLTPKSISRSPKKRSPKLEPHSPPQSQKHQNYEKYQKNYEYEGYMGRWAWTPHRLQESQETNDYKENFSQHPPLDDSRTYGQSLGYDEHEGHRDQKRPRIQESPETVDSFGRVLLQYPPPHGSSGRPTYDEGLGSSFARSAHQQHDQKPDHQQQVTPTLSRMGSFPTSDMSEANKGDQSQSSVASPYDQHYIHTEPRQEAYVTQSDYSSLCNLGPSGSTAVAAPPHMSCPYYNPSQGPYHGLPAPVPAQHMYHQPAQRPLPGPPANHQGFAPPLMTPSASFQAYQPAEFSPNMAEYGSADMSGAMVRPRQSTPGSADMIDTNHHNGFDDPNRQSANRPNVNYVLDEMHDQVMPQAGESVAGVSYGPIPVARTGLVYMENLSNDPLSRPSISDILARYQHVRVSEWGVCLARESVGVRIPTGETLKMHYLPVTREKTVQLADDASKEDRCLLELHKKYRDDRGKGMWDSITDKYFKQFPTQERGPTHMKETARLQMRLMRAFRRFCLWPVNDAEILLSTFTQHPPRAYALMCATLKKSVGHDVAWDWTEADVEMFLVRCGLVQQGENATSRSRRRKRAAERLVPVMQPAALSDPALSLPPNVPLSSVGRYPAGSLKQNPSSFTLAAY